jgi:hypothetical protein
MRPLMPSARAPEPKVGQKFADQPFQANKKALA